MKKYPLFPSQLGVFLECLAYPDTTQYNLPFQTKRPSSEDDGFHGLKPFGLKVRVSAKAE